MSRTYRQLYYYCSRLGLWATCRTETASSALSCVPAPRPKLQVPSCSMAPVRHAILFVPIIIVLNFSILLCEQGIHSLGVRQSDSEVIMHARGTGRALFSPINLSLGWLKIAELCGPYACPSFQIVLYHAFPIPLRQRPAGTACSVLNNSIIVNIPRENNFTRTKIEHS